MGGGGRRPHSAQPQHTNDWAPRTRKRHPQEHRPQRPTERSDPTQHAKGRTGDCPGPRKGATTRRNVTQGGAGPPEPAHQRPVVLRKICSCCLFTSNLSWQVRPFVHPSVADRLAAEHAPLGDAKDPATSYHSSAWSGDPIDPEDWDHSSEDRFGRSCLHIAVYKLHKDIIRALLEGGADCTKRDAKKWNAMHWLCASTKTVASREAHAEFLASSLGEWWRAVRGGALRGLRKGSASSVFRATEDAARQCEIAEMLWGAPGGRALCEQRDEDGLLPIHYCKNTYFVQWLKEHGPSLTHDARAYFLPRMLLFLLLSLPFGTVPLVVICINAVVSRSLRLGQALCGKGVAVFRTPLTLVVVLVAMLAMFTLPFLAFGLDSVADALWLPFSQMAVMILFMGVLAGKMTMERKYFYVRHPHDSVQQLNLANLFPLVGVCTDYFGLAQYQFEPTGLNDVDIGLSFLFDVDLRPYLDIMWFVTSMSAIIAWFLLASYIALALMVYSVRVDKLTQHRLSQSTTVCVVIDFVSSCPFPLTLTFSKPSAVQYSQNPHPMSTNCHPVNCASKTSNTNVKNP